MICQACFHHCELSLGQKGYCLARENKDGKIVAANYGLITSLALDPIEKKPLAYFYPGSYLLSVGSFGCNLACPFCQNYKISKANLSKEAVYLSPEDLVAQAISLKDQNNIGIAFTYNEPLVGYEYVRDTSKLAQENNLKTVLVTNGCFTDEVIDQILPYIDAMNIDLKGFSTEYFKYIGGDLEMTKNFIKKVHSKTHIELTTLLIPGKNDSEEEIRKMAAWIACLDPNIPLHLTRYFPRYKCKLPPTDYEDLLRAKKNAEEYLFRVKLGNV